MSDHQFTLRVNGKPFTGWKDIKVIRSIERLAGQFEIGASNAPLTPCLFGTIQGGEACTVEIDGHVVLDGYVDMQSGSYEEKNSADKFSGRDRTGDLMDCAATVDGPYEYLGQKLENVVAIILKPFNIQLTVVGDITGKVFNRLAIQPGETAWEFIDRSCKYRALLPVSDGVGGLILTKPGTVKSPGRLVYGENIKSAEACIDVRDRFSLYVVKGQGEVLGLETPEESAQTEGRATDAGVRRYRPTVITGESQEYNITQQQRAEWQAKFNKARSKKVTYVVQGWYAAPGQLWLPNTLVNVQDTKLQIAGDRLISSVTYARSDNEGTTTTLELVMPDAFDIPAAKDKEDIWGDL